MSLCATALSMRMIIDWSSCSLGRWVEWMEVLLLTVYSLFIVRKPRSLVSIDFEWRARFSWSEQTVGGNQLFLVTFAHLRSCARCHPSAHQPGFMTTFCKQPHGNPSRETSKGSRDDRKRGVVSFKGYI